MVSWAQMKERVAEQMSSDPQRGTLSQRAAAAVEEGLRHLAGVGYPFEIAPKGTLAAQAIEQQLPLALSIPQAQAKVGKPAPNVQAEKFNSMVAAGPQ